jgi:hypothetical protein
MESWFVTDANEHIWTRSSPSFRSVQQKCNLQDIQTPAPLHLSYFLFGFITNLFWNVKHTVSYQSAIFTYKYTDMLWVE